MKACFPLLVEKPMTHQQARIVIRIPHSVVAVALLTSAVASPLAAATIYVSPHGDDTHAGTRKEPLRTISAAALRAVPGDVVLVLEGVYRERVAPRRGGKPGKPIVYRGEPGKRVFIKGSVVWAPPWKGEGGGVYSARPDESLFDDRSPEYLDHQNPLQVQLASTPWHRQGRREAERRRAGDTRIGRADDRIVYTCGQVFVGGKRYREVPLKEELVPQTWWYEPAGERVHVDFGGLDPTQQEVELTTRRRLFAPIERGLGHIVVEGFIFEHCGNQYPTNFWDTDTNAQKGAVGTEAGHHWVIRHNVVRYAKTFAIDCGRVDRHSPTTTSHENLIEQNYIVDNGSAGILTSGSVNLVIRDNVILRNNQLRFEGIKRWEQAGIKCHQFDKGLIEHNYIAYNYDMSGIWLDNQFPDSRVTRNVIHGNGTRGIFLEMSDYDFDRLLVDNNLVFGNKENAVYIHDASGATFVNNLLANTPDAPGNGQAIYILQVSPRTKTYHHSFFNNLLIGNARNVEVNYPAARSGPQRFDHNLYGVLPGARAFVINDKSDKPSPWAPQEFQELVLADLGLKLPPQGMLEGENRAALDLRQWRLFWQRHGLDNDTHSGFAPEGRVSYQPETHVLTVTLQANPREIGCKAHPALHDDFFGQERTNHRDVPPGPFRDLRRGGGRFVIWTGLPILENGELPAARWTSNRCEDGHEKTLTRDMRPRSSNSRKELRLW